MNEISDWLRKNLTNEQLQNLYTFVFDRWCWDTGNDVDRRLLESLDAERSIRKDLASSVLSSTLTFVGGPGVIVTDDPNDSTVTISIDENYQPKPPTVVITEGPHGKL